MLIYATTPELKEIGDAIMVEKNGLERSPDTEYVMWIDKKTREVLWCCAYDTFWGLSCRMHIANMGKRYIPKEFLWAMFDFPFNKRGVRIAIAPVDSANKTSMVVVPKFGFVEGIRYYGAYQFQSDLIMFKQEKSDCKFIQPRFMSKIYRKENSGPK